MGPSSVSCSIPVHLPQEPASPLLRSAPTDFECCARLSVFDGERKSRQGTLAGKRTGDRKPRNFNRCHRICLSLEDEDVGLLATPDVIKPIAALPAVPGKASFESPHEIPPAPPLNAEAHAR